MSLLDFDLERYAHPVDIIEHVAHTLAWNFERTGDDEIVQSTIDGMDWSGYLTGLLRSR